MVQFSLLQDYFPICTQKRISCFGQTIIVKTFVKGGALIYISYVSALVLRIAINAVFIGFQEINFTERGDIVTRNIPLVLIGHNTMTICLIATDFLLMLGSGMFIGRNARVIEFFYRRHKALRAL